MIHGPGTAGPTAVATFARTWDIADFCGHVLANVATRFPLDFLLAEVQFQLDFQLFGPLAPGS